MLDDVGDAVEGVGGGALFGELGGHCFSVEACCFWDSFFAVDGTEVDFVCVCEGLGEFLLEGVGGGGVGAGLEEDAYAGLGPACF